MPQQPTYFSHRLRADKPDGCGGNPGFPLIRRPCGDAAAADSNAGGLTIKSPTIGTFYAAPSPTDPPFVTVGAVVTPETVVCTIEQMKVFNQIQAGVSGTITAVLIKSGDAVEFDTPLFRYKS